MSEQLTLFDAFRAAEGLELSTCDLCRDFDPSAADTPGTPEYVFTHYFTSFSRWDLFVDAYWHRQNLKVWMEKFYTAQERIKSLTGELI